MEETEVKEKKSTMLYLNQKDVEMAKRLKLNISQIAGSALEYVLKHSELQPVYTEIILLNQDIKRLKMENDVKTNEIKEIGARIIELEQKRKILENQLEISQRDTRIAKLFAELRDISSTYNYNMDKVWIASRDIRGALSKEGIDYDMGQLDAFVKRIQS